MNKTRNTTARKSRAEMAKNTRFIILGSLALCLLAPLQLSGQTCSGGNCTAASLSTSDVQACINSTTAGHTCTLPAGSATWTSGVTVNKAITVQGAGAGRIVAYAYTGSVLAIGTGSKSLTITGSTFVSGTPPATSALTAIPITTGQTVRLSELGFRSHFMQGTVSSWNSSTGALTLNVTSSGGTCGTTDPNMPSNCKRWLLSTIPATVIAHNVSGIMWNLTEATTGSMYISGIKFATGSGTGATIYTNRTSGGQAIVIHDCWIENINGIIPIDGNTDRGLFYNDSIDNSPFSVIEDIRIKDPNNTAMPTSWTTVSTFGTNDTAATPFCSTCLAGQNNQYIENVDFHAGENVIDWDDNARGVVRYSFFNNAGMGSHGADTSEVGVRHFEIYNNVGGFVGYNDGTTANMNWWLFTRGGTTAMHDNVFPAISSTDYGTKSDVTMPVENLDRNGGQHPCWGEGTTGGADYYAPRQNGFGRVTGTGTTSGSQSSCPSGVNCSGNHFSGSTDAYTYVGDSEPVYLWNNRRTTAGSTVNLTVSAGTPIGECTSPDSTSNYVVAGRDYFNNGTAKPSYTPYTYPHPLAAFAGHSYSTTFPATENPISESGVWLNGAANGLDWDNVQTTTNKVFGTGIQGNPPYNDSTAALTGSWNANQEASGVLYLANGSDTASQEEVELRLNTSVSAHSITGYECDLSAYSGAYAAIVRWNGPVNNFTQLAFAPSVTPIHNGDTFKCTKIGSAITMYINGASILTATDSTYTNGAPGIGFWQTGGTTAMLSHYGFSSFSADDTPGTPPVTYTWNLSVVGSGTVTGTNSTSGTYNYGTTIGPLTTTPGTGYFFAGWGSVIGSALCSGTTSPCPSFSLVSNSTATATFSPNTYVLSTATSGTGSGSVTCSPPSGGVVYNTAVSCTVTANTGSSISGVTGCGGTWASSPYTFNMPASNCTVTASFTLGTQTLTVASSGAGSGTISGPNCSSGSYSFGTTIGPCVAAANSTSTFTAWTGTGDASTCSGTGSCTFVLNNVSTLTAGFDKQTAATPTFSPSAGTYSGTQTVTITSATGVTMVAVLPETQNANSSTGVAPHRNTYTNCATGYSGGQLQPAGQPVGSLYCTSSDKTAALANGGPNNGVVTSTITGLGTTALDNGNGAGGSDSPTSLTATYGGSGSTGCAVGLNNASGYVSGLTLPGATSTSQAVFSIITPSSGFNTSLLSVTKYNQNGDAGRYLARQDCVNLNNVTATGAHYEVDDNYNTSGGTYMGFGWDYDLPNQKFRACPQGCSGWTNLELCPVGGGACLTTYTPPSSGQYLYMEKYEHWDSGCSYSSASACAHYDAMCLQLWSGGSAVAPIACYTVQNASTHSTVDFIPINKTTWTHPQYGPQHQWDINSGSKTMTATVAFSSLTAYNGTSTATICYTTDGSTPTADGNGTCTHGTTYTGPITVSSSQTVKSIASEAGYNDSAVGSAAYVINGSAATPTFSPVAGTYGSAQSVTVTSSTAGATICYTVDGSTPTADGAGTCTHGTTYAGPVSVSTSLTLKAIASKSGFTDSAVGSAAYTITAAVRVTITGKVQGAIIQ